MASCLPAYLQWIERGTSAFSLLANVLLIILIACRTPSELRIYSRVLLVSAINDLVFTVTNLGIGLHISIRRGYGIYTVGELFSSSSLEVRFFATIVYWFIMYLAIFIVAVPFVYRYFAVCRSHIMSYGRFTMLVAFEVVLSMAMCSGLGSLWWPLVQASDREYYAHMPRNTCSDAGDIAYFRLADTVHYPFAPVFVYYIVVVDLHYVLIIWCSYKVWKQAKTSTSLTTRMTKMNRQLNIILGFQALTPMAVAVVPVVGCISAILLNAESTMAETFVNLTTVALGCIPAINPLYTILFVKAYRRAVCESFRKMFVVRSSTNTSSVFPSRTSRTDTLAP